MIKNYQEWKKLKSNRIVEDGKKYTDPNNPALAAATTPITTSTTVNAVDTAKSTTIINPTEPTTPPVKKTEEPKKANSEKLRFTLSPPTLKIPITVFKTSKSGNVYSLAKYILVVLNKVLNPVPSIVLNASDELDEKKLGDNTVLLVKALIQTFVELELIKTPTKESGKPSLEIIDNKVAEQISKITMVSEEEDDAILSGIEAAFGPNFGSTLIGKLKTVKLDIKTTAVDVGDIKFPVTPTSGEDQIKKAQRVMLNYINKYKKDFDDAFADDVYYKKFLKFADDGDYGTSTKYIVAMLKAAVNLNDTAGDKITEEFIKKLV